MKSRLRRVVVIASEETAQDETTSTKTSEDPTSQQQTPQTPRKPLGPVFWVSVAITGVFCLVGVISPKEFGAALTSIVSDWVNPNLGWLLLLLTTFFLGFIIWLGFSRFGSIRLGGPDARPEFRTFSWFSMLFQAGMGVGLLFWGVSQPVLHAAEPPPGLADPNTVESAQLGVAYSLFHWALHPWAIYAVVGVAVGYFAYARGENSLRISSVLRPLFGDRVDGTLGRAVDILGIIATLFGIAVSLGLGTLQIEAGLSRFFGFPDGVVVQFGIIIVTGVAYLLSAATPIEKGIQTLSNLSFVIAVMLLGYFFVVGPTIVELNAATQSIGDYASKIVPWSTRTSSFNENPWLGEWTIFFWATWIAWAPYVGAFIARISKGRTIREFLLGALVAPSIFSVLWFGVFGGAGIHTDRAQDGNIAEAAKEGGENGMFAFVELYPLGTAIAALVLFLVWIFFVAGADAGTVVLGSMSSDGDDNPRTSVKIVWGVIAAVLLAAGGLDTLQYGAILASLPFALIMVLICVSLVRALREDHPDGS